MTDLVHKLATTTVAEYATRRGCSVRAVYKAIKRCGIPLVDGRLDPLLADTLWSARTDPDQQRRSMGQNRNGAAQPPAGGMQDAVVPSDDYSSIRRRRELQELRLVEMDVQEREGQLVRLEEVEKTAKRAASAIVQQQDVIVERFPAEFGVDDAQRREMRRRLREEFNRIRAEFAKLGWLAVQ